MRFASAVLALGIIMITVLSPRMIVPQLQFALFHYIPGGSAVVETKSESAISNSMNSFSSLVVNPVAYGGKCSKGKASAIAAKMPLMKLICSKKAEWMSPFLKMSQKTIPTIVTVGCNIAGAFLANMREWSHNTTYSVHSMQPYHAKLPSVHFCWQPHDPKVDGAKTRAVRGFCVEPVQSTAKVLRRAFRELGWDSEVTLIEAVVSSSKGKTHFSNVAAGAPNMGPRRLAKVQNTNNVEVTTLDELAAKHGITGIDVLSIDTEGNGMHVISGGVRTLPKVRYLQFEHHTASHRRESGLQGLVALLDTLGFDCFWAGSNGELWRLTGCWHDSYHKGRGSSRVACANRREPGAALLAAMTRVAERNGASWDVPSPPARFSPRDATRAAVAPRTLQTAPPASVRSESGSDA
jgi:FkbM family methyltransferase